MKRFGWALLYVAVRTVSDATAAASRLVAKQLVRACEGMDVKIYCRKCKTWLVVPEQDMTTEDARRLHDRNGCSLQQHPDLAELAELATTIEELY